MAQGTERKAVPTSCPRSFKASQSSCKVQGKELSFRGRIQEFTRNSKAFNLILSSWGKTTRQLRMGFSKQIHMGRSSWRIVFFLHFFAKLKNKRRLEWKIELFVCSYKYKRKGTWIARYMEVEEWRKIGFKIVWDLWTWLGQFKSNKTWSFAKKQFFVILNAPHEGLRWIYF